MKDIKYKTAFVWSYDLGQGSFNNSYTLTINLVKRDKAYNLAIAPNIGRIKFVHLFEKGSQLFAVITPKNGDSRIIYALNTTRDVTPEGNIGNLVIGRVPVQYPPVLCAKYVVSSLGLGKESLTSKDIEAKELVIFGAWVNVNYVTKKESMKSAKQAEKAKGLKQKISVNGELLEEKTHYINAPTLDERPTLSLMSEE